jgi:hypothetical protein
MSRLSSRLRFMRTMTVSAALVGMIVIAAAAPAHATPVLPGQTVAPSVVGGNPGTLVTSIEDQAFIGRESSGLVAFTGHLTSAVYRNAAGLLDFYFQIVDDTTSPGAINRIVLTPFGTALSAIVWAADVGFRPDGNSQLFDGTFAHGDVAPDTIDRSGLTFNNGQSIGFNFSTADQLSPGQTSFVLVVRTNQVSFAPGNGGVIGGSAGDTSASLESAAEPMTLALLGTGLLGLVAATRARLSAQSRARG